MRYTYTHIYNIVSSRSEGKAKLGKDARRDSLSLRDTRVKRRATPGFNERWSIFIARNKLLLDILHDVTSTLEGNAIVSRDLINFFLFFFFESREVKRLYIFFFYFAFFLGNYIWNIYIYIDSERLRVPRGATSWSSFAEYSVFPVVCLFHDT